MPMPLHPKARELAKSGLFAGLSSFEELERRIAAISDNKGKGDAFEVFAEAYLATQRKHDAHQVWPLNAMPLDLLAKLGLGGMDYGIDGVLQSLLGDLNAYQVKFRTGREPMTWRELSTFMGLADSPHIRSRILITNCDELPQVINERQGFFCIRGSDLDRMEVSDFQAIEAWLAEAAIQAPKKKPLPHQEEALAAIVPTLQKESRATAIMACGTGKTLVTLWTAEQLGARKILVLLPSLALLRQTLHEWLKETSLDPLAYLCVCSDPTVKGDADEISTAQSDLDFEVSTNPEVVRRFLDAPFDGTKIVFSTYQSASVVGEALKPGESFDLGIFDEAHKTAGREGSKLSFALRDENLAIAKRLFVTATPRHYNPRNKNKSGDMEMVYSMDRPEVFGNRVYTLSFSQAAKREIICGYKVVISVITSEMVTNELINRGQVQISGDYVQARQVANQIALRDAVHKFGVERIFTFHNTVKSAASFVSSGNEGVHNHLPEFGAFHVSGAMSTAQRERIMRDFRSSSKGIMSNARCLTEGVDVPAVDMVAFLSPRRSLVDIVQATGRAMRKSPGKDLGYVLVPLYVELEAGESIDEAVARANFDEIWDILQTLQEQDEVLAELISQSARTKASFKEFGKNPIYDRIIIEGSILGLNSIQSAVTTQILECLVSSWSLNYGKLQDFKEEYGHSNPDIDCVYLGTHLGKWLSLQRSFYKKNKLTSERIEKLNLLGVNWSHTDFKWNKAFEALLEYKQINKHLNVPSSYVHNQFKLGQWVVTQRGYFKSGKLTKNRMKSLESIGFQFSLDRTISPNLIGFEFLTDSIFEEIKDFYNRNGHFNIPYDYRVKKLPIGKWVEVVRGLYCNKLIDNNLFLNLNLINFTWTKKSSEWGEIFSQLKKFKSMNGHCLVTRLNSSGKLVRWVTLQRRFYSQGKLSSNQIEMMEKIGFDWKV